jgi:hypothetical protein
VLIGPISRAPQPQATPVRGVAGITEAGLCASVPQHAVLEGLRPTSVTGDAHCRLDQASSRTYDGQPTADVMPLVATFTGIRLVILGPDSLDTARVASRTDQHECHPTGLGLAIPDERSISGGQGVAGSSPASPTVFPQVTGGLALGQPRLRRPVRDELGRNTPECALKASCWFSCEMSR